MQHIVGLFLIHILHLYSFEVIGANLPVITAKLAYVLAFKLSLEEVLVIKEYWSIFWLHLFLLLDTGLSGHIIDYYGLILEVKGQLVIRQLSIGF